MDPISEGARRAGWGPLVPGDLYIPKTLDLTRNSGAEPTSRWQNLVQTECACNSNVTSINPLIARDGLSHSSLITPYASYWNCICSSWLDSLGTKWGQEFFISRPHSMETVEPLKNLREFLWCYCIYEQKAVNYWECLSGFSCATLSTVWSRLR